MALEIDDETKELMAADQRVIEGYPPPPSPTFSPEELNLLHQLLVQTPFAEAEMKVIAASAQARIERFVGQ